MKSKLRDIFLKLQCFPKIFASISSNKNFRFEKYNYKAEQKQMNMLAEGIVSYVKCIVS